MSIISLLKGRASYVAEAFRLAFPTSYKGAKLVVVLTAYLDASGTEKALTVAGYVSDMERWVQFERDWKESLGAYGLEFFHMTDFAAGQGLYKDWGDKRPHRLRRLLSIINRVVLASVSITVPLERYNAVLSYEEKAQGGNSYSLAAFGCFHEITRWMRSHRSPDDEIAYVYEQGDQGRGEVLKIFNLVYDDPDLRQEHRLLSLRFEDKRRFVPLQTADILAWEVNQEALKHLGLDDRASRKEIPLLKGVPWHSWAFADDNALKYLAGIFSAVNIKRGKGWDTSNPIGDQL